MSSLDALYKDTVTLFNRVVDEDGDYWYPTVLYNVHAVIDKAKMISTYGERTSDNMMLNVRYSGTRDEPYIEGKKYYQPKEYQKAVGEGANPAKIITFGYGEPFDFLYHGVWTGGVVRDTNYTSGFFNYMNQQYDEVFAISSCSKYNLILHFTVTGR